MFEAKATIALAMAGTLGAPLRAGSDGEHNLADLDVLLVLARLAAAAQQNARRGFPPGRRSRVSKLRTSKTIWYARPVIGRKPSQGFSRPALTSPSLSQSSRYLYAIARSFSVARAKALE